MLREGHGLAVARGENGREAVKRYIEGPQAVQRDTKPLQLPFGNCRGLFIGHRGHRAIRAFQFGLDFGIGSQSLGFCDGYAVLGMLVGDIGAGEGLICSNQTAGGLVEILL